MTNSRGTWINQRTAGDTLAISDRVAITPTIQPAAAGTQENLDAGWTPVRRPRLMTVISRENRRSTRQLG
ncbi:hypothetical protein MFTT_34930 [Mycolicibacterium fortuitum subsp. fortuitum]|nr:hypothetical protein MFTT_34930 [Mycolicibacterium fortuitum subsp. fortuitum]